MRMARIAVIMGFAWAAMGCAEDAVAPGSLVAATIPPGLELPWRRPPPQAYDVRLRDSIQAAQRRVDLAERMGDMRQSRSAAILVAPVVRDVVNVNTATLAELVRLPRIGPAMAQRIVDARPYLRIEDLRRVRGIGASTLRHLAHRVRVE